MSYGPDLAEAYRHAGRYAARILDGAAPRDLPVQATAFDGAGLVPFGHPFVIQFKNVVIQSGWFVVHGAPKGMLPAATWP